MPDTTIETPRQVTATTARSIVVRHIRFVTHPVTGTWIRRTFKHPRPCLAVEQTIDLSELPRQRSSPEAMDSLYIVYVPPEAKAEWERIGSGWLLPPGDPEAPEAVTISALGDQIHWRPSRVVVEGKAGLRDEIVAGLTEFAFYEGELRALEQSIETCEAQARVDAPRTFRIHKKDRAEWPRFGEVIESLAQFRLTFAALEPKVERGSRVLTKPGREVATRLFRAATTSFRMEGLDGRLEVCEELYEGAIDRIADYRGWHTGHVLEVIIIALLLAEAGLMAAELFLRIGE
jgi:hypothetical protein